MKITEQEIYEHLKNVYSRESLEYNDRRCDRITIDEGLSAFAAESCDKADENGNRYTEQYGDFDEITAEIMPYINDENEHYRETHADEN